MRKLLLATAATLSVGIGLASEVHAQAFPTPGTVTVRLNGRMRFYAGDIQDSDVNNNVQGSANGATPLTGQNKLATYRFGVYSRLYPGFDGVAANGLKYGVSLEIRQDQSSGAGGGVYGSISQQDRARAALYFRRETGYIGTDKLGTIRVGATDGPNTLYLTGTFENFNDGGWNGDAPGLIAGNAVAVWPFADIGNLYTTTKVIYLSPQLYGFDFGVSYEPNTGNVLNTSGCGTGGPLGTNFVTPGGAVQGTISAATGVGGGAAGTAAGTGSTATTIGAAGANGQSVAGPGCDALSSTPTGDYTRRRNTFDGLIRYRGSFAGFGVAATAGYIGSGKIDDNSTPQRAVQYDGLSVGDAGLTVTYGGFQVGGNYQYGKYNEGYALLQKNAPNAEAWIVGASYTLGPVIVGASYFDFVNAGNTTESAFGRQRREQGIAAGGTYSVAPGLSLFASYLYGQRKQNGFNFVTGVAGDPNHNRMTSQAFVLGTSFAW